MSERLKYIDALRGLAMLMVVFVHVEGFSVFIEEFHMSLFRRLCEAVMLPLFFFISGFVIKISSVQSLISRCTQLLVPALILGLLYTFYIGKDVYSFIHNVYKYGYWFTVTLSEMLIVLWLIIRLSKTRISLIITLLITSILLYLVKVPFNNIVMLDNIADTLCLHQLFLYFHFFSIGIILAKNRDLLDKLLKNDYIIFCGICVFASSLYIRYTYTDEQLASNILIYFYRAVQEPILGYSGIILLFKLFHDNNFISETIVGKSLQHIGRHTLDIYLLHYFFLPKLPQLGTFLMQCPNILIEVGLVLFLSVLVITCTLACSKVIANNSFLGFFLLGSKLKDLKCK